MIKRKIFVKKVQNFSDDKVNKNATTDKGMVTIRKVWFLRKGRLQFLESYPGKMNEIKMQEKQINI